MGQPDGLLGDPGGAVADTHAHADADGSTDSDSDGDVEPDTGRDADSYARAERRGSDRVSRGYEQLGR